MTSSFPSGQSVQSALFSSLRPSPSVPSDSVREIETRDGAVLLDIQRGLCLAMTPSAILIWQMLKRAYSIDQVTDSLALQFSSESHARIQQDVRQFIAELKDKGLLVTQETAPLSGPTLREKLLALVLRHRSRKDSRTTDKIPRFLVWKALLGLVVFDLFHFGNSFTWIHRFVRSWEAGSPMASTQAVERVCEAINFACIWYPKRVLCLQRSAVTTCLLRSCGVAAEMVLGAQKCPFKAHAWTEVGGQPINERRDVRTTYLVWDRC